MLDKNVLIPIFLYISSYFASFSLFVEDKKLNKVFTFIFRVCLLLTIAFLADQVRAFAG